MLPPSFKWKRFWCPTSGQINLADGGFLVDPDSECESLWNRNPDVLPFESIADTPCLVLLGEPGTGKSVALQSECERLQAAKATQGLTDLVLAFDLREFQTDARLHQVVFECQPLRSWIEGGYRLQLFLDSLDEGLLRIENIAAVLSREFAGLPRDRLSIRIACRTTEWPAGLQSSLAKLWGSQAVKVLEIAPLRRADVIEAAQAFGLSADQFIHDIEVHEAVPLAIKPITLSFLLRAYKRHGRLPNKQIDLYAEGCRLLCEEPSEGRRDARRTGLLTA